MYARHETMDLHEIATFKTVCLTKSKTMQLLVSDPELKKILQQDVDVTTIQLQELKQLLSNVAPEGGAKS
jgi:similar to spore coat protein